MSRPAPAGGACVGFDKARAIRQAVHHLLDLGHRRVAMRAGRAHKNDRAAARIAGVRQALKRGGLKLPPQPRVGRPDGPAQARPMGSAVPDELSLIGCDGLEPARHNQPALTTLHVPTRRLRHTVAERVIAAPEQAPVQVATEGDVELVVREPSGPAPGLRR